MKVHYWKLPSMFLGDRVTSYGGFLNYTIRHVPQPGGRNSPNTAPDVEIRVCIAKTFYHLVAIIVRYILQGNAIRLLHYRREQIDASRPVSVSVQINEQHWQREDGRPADREHLLMVLADLDSILVKATYTTRTSESGY